jgi:hypothetical protein
VLAETVADPCAGSQPSQSSSGQGQAAQPAPIPATQGEQLVANTATAPVQGGAQGAQAAISAGGAINPSQNLARGLTGAQKKRVISLHNYYRSLEGASDMNMLVGRRILPRLACSNPAFS